MTHFVLLLYAGDYRDARARRAAGLSDYYRHHSYALDSLERVRSAGARVSVIQTRSDVAYDEIGEDGLRYLGLGRGNSSEVGEKIEAYLRSEEATHVMVRFPAVDLLDRITSLPLRVSVVLADSFPSRYRNYRRYRAMGQVLSHPRVDFVANHQLNSSRQLVAVLGIDPRRVVPWDWPLDLVDLASRSARPHPGHGPIRLLYVGSISRIKGVWDALEALAILRDRGQDAVLDVAGSGNVEDMWDIVDRLSLRDRVTHHGRVGGDEILGLMRAATFVCVPSRHSYPEGLPLTLYEAMASGTPLVASDHPMFAGVVRDGETGFVFPAGKPARLASTVLQAWRDPDGYRRVSATAAATYPSMGLRTLWGDVAARWVSGTQEDLEWLSARSLAVRED